MTRAAWVMPNHLSRVFSWLRQALEESPGVPSSIRAQMLAVFMFAGALPLSVWAYISISRGEPAEIPPGLISFCGLLFSVATGAKVFQQRAE